MVAIGDSPIVKPMCVVALTVSHARSGIPLGDRNQYVDVK